MTAKRSNDHPLRMRLMTAYALCATAESQVRVGDSTGALKSTEAVRQIISEVSLRLSEPEFPPVTGRELSDLLTDLQQRVRKTERIVQT